MTARRVLVRLPNWLGDLLMSRPLLHALRATLPDAEIAAIGTGAARLLARERLWDAFGAWPPDPGTAAILGGARYDAALVLPPSFSSAWRLPPGVAIRVGFADDGRSPLLTHPLPRPARGEMHLSEEYLRLGAPLGVHRAPLPALDALPEERAAARASFAPSGAPDRPIAILGPGAAFGPAKRWPAGRFVELGRRLAAAGHRVLVAGSAEDRGIAEPLAAAIGGEARSTAGRTRLEEQLALCAIASVVVSNDSGLAHLAAAAATRTVVIFGSTSSAWTAPLGPRVTVLQRAPVCAPCFRRDCRIGYRCLAAVSVEAVERACVEAAA